jgi:hypothetical protein
LAPSFGKNVGAVDKDVTHTFVVLDDRNSCVLGDEPNQSFSTSRDDHVQNTIKTNHHQSRLSIRGGQKCDSLGRQAFFLERLSEDRRDRRVALERLFAAPKQDRIAALEAKGGRVRCHVRPGFIDDSDEP